MKRIVAALALSALAACGSDEVADDAAAAEPVAEAAPITNNAEPGTYEITLADGTTRTSVLEADRSYTDTVDGQVVERGSWAVVGGKTCFTPSEGAGAVPMCYTESEIGADGTFTATPDQGEPVTVLKVS